MKERQPDVNFIIPERTPFTWREHIDFLKADQAKSKESSKAQEYAKVKIRSDSPIGIVFTGDWHIGSAGTDYDTWLKHMNFIKNEPNAFMALMSNTIDNFVFPSGQFAQMNQPHEQMEIVRGMAEDFGKKIVGIVGSRCHEGWSSDKVDINPNELMFRQNIDQGTPFLSTGGVVELEVNDVKYSMGLVHKGRFHSSLNPTNLNRQMHDLRWPVDILVAAHHHTAQVLQTTKYEGPYEKDVVFIRTGTYKKDDAYSEHEGFGKGDIASPIVILDHKQKKMQAFYNLEDGIKYLAALRELEQYKK